MSIRRIGVLFWKELVHGLGSFMFILAIVFPVVISLVLSLLFGTFFTGKARLGIVDLGASRLPELASEVSAIDVEIFATEGELVDVVERGRIDMGMVLPAGFDVAVADDRQVDLTAYLWGESQLKHRTILATSLITAVRTIAGQESPVRISMQTVGGDVLPWEERFLPLIVLLSVLISGVMATATSVVEEKVGGTLTALTVTPLTLGEVLTAKGLLGVLVAVAMGVISLFLNNAFGAHPWLLVLTLFLGAVFASTIGILLGMWVKDINTLFAMIKSLGIILYAPALIYLFPSIPQWIARIFPTYYIIQPVIEIVQQGGAFSDVRSDLLILTLMIAALVAAAAALAPVAAAREA